MGARMVDFGGWDMPLHYGSQLDEHHAVRRTCGMFDVSHMLAIDIRGNGSREYLEYVLANNVGRLQVPGKALYSCLLNEDGGVIDDLIVYFFADDWFRLVVNASTADGDCAWLVAQRDKQWPQVEITPRRDLAIIAVQGPVAREKVFAVVPAAAEAAAKLSYFSAARIGDSMLARTGYTGEDGFEIILPATDAVDLWQRLREHGVTAAGLAARDTLRLEAGMNLYGQDMDETTTPLESGLAWTVDLKSPRDFIGKRALQKAPVERRALGLLLIDKGVMRAHQTVSTPDGEGEITSGGFGPTLARSLALARVPIAVRPGDEVNVAIRDKLLRARVVTPPFVRHGKVLVA
ncbi:MAG: glycine cleavage system protein [Betaproteobacteria bacterium]|nr:glycine cleavage system protein [Betaproteobacteria bacterium]